jgi:hypothetical protein
MNEKDGLLINWSNKRIVHISSMTDTETTNWEGNHEKSIGK